MSIEAISRFNGGNGGVSIITHDLGGKECGAFLNPQEAIKFSVEILRKAYASLNQEFPVALEDDIKRNFKYLVRVSLPVKVE